MTCTTSHTTLITRMKGSRHFKSDENLSARLKTECSSGTKLRRPQPSCFLSRAWFRWIICKTLKRTLKRTGAAYLRLEHPTGSVKSELPKMRILFSDRFSLKQRIFPLTFLQTSHIFIWSFRRLTNTEWGMNEVEGCLVIIFIKSNINHACLLHSSSSSLLVGRRQAVSISV